MFHGGTNFGFINGGNNVTGSPVYVTTSYDYNAPLREDGRPNNKFYILRKAIFNHLASDTSKSDLSCSAFVFQCVFIIHKLINSH